MAIERSAGIPVSAGAGGFSITPRLVGGGYLGATPELDTVVQQAARALETAYCTDIVIRFNSDRESGGAWLRTPEVDGIHANAEVGIGASVVTERTRRRWEAHAQDWARWAQETGGTDDGYWADRLRECPTGLLTIYAHIRSTSVAKGQLDSLRRLPGWNDMSHSGGYGYGYHHGAADSVEQALARCRQFAPQVAFRPASANSKAG